MPQASQPASHGDLRDIFQNRDVVQRNFTMSCFCEDKKGRLPLRGMFSRLNRYGCNSPQLAAIKTAVAMEICDFQATLSDTPSACGGVVHVCLA
jgi:hypothetical protein